ncbi:MAG: nucleotide exchange factor GrpE [Chloroflexota bacterium]
MTDKKTRKSKPEKKPEAGSAPGNGEQAQVQEETQAVSAEAFADLEARLAEAESKSAEYLDGWQRARAEFMNYKNRIERDQALTAEMMRAQNIKKFLPVIDDLERALANRPAEAEAWVEGIELVYRKLLAVLDGEGVKRIEAEGQPFDPNLHEAISMEPVDGFESGQVIGVVQAGYKLGDRVIRPAMVRVAQ